METHLINLFGNLCEVLISIFFFSGSCKLRVKKKTVALLFPVFTLLLFLSTTLFLGKSYLLIPCALAVMLGMSLLYRLNWAQRIIFTIFLYLIHSLSELIIGMAFSIIFTSDIRVLQSDCILFSACTLLSKFAAYIFALILRKKRFKNGLRVVKQNIFLVFSLPIASILVMILLLRCFYQINDNTFLVISLITAVVLAVGNITVFYVMDKQNELIETKKKLVFTEEHINNQVLHYTELYKYQKELREFRHDIKNRLLALTAMLEANQNEKALLSMESCLNIIDETNQNIVNSGNPIIDAILQSKLNLAKKEKIRLKPFVRFESDIKIDEIELGIILGNALDNAIEGVNRIEGNENKYIDFRLIATEGRISLAISNPVKDNIDVTRLATEKKDSRKHGLGISSIKSLSEKYDGIVDFTCENRIFTVNINLSNGE